MTNTPIEKKITFITQYITLINVIEFGIVCLHFISHKKSGKV